METSIRNPPHGSIHVSELVLVFSPKFASWFCSKARGSSLLVLAVFRLGAGSPLEAAIELARDKGQGISKSPRMVFQNKNLLTVNTAVIKKHNLYC